VDVVFAAAGGTGIGVYQAAKDAGKLAIGVDSNQNHLHPGTMLTSMVKRVDVAVYNASRAQAGVTVLGLKEGGVDYALDEHNAKLVSRRHEEAKVDAAKADIIAARSRSSTTWPPTSASEPMTPPRPPSRGGHAIGIDKRFGAVQANRAWT
jgi:basic membrane protein A